MLVDANPGHNRAVEHPPPRYAASSSRDGRTRPATSKPQAGGYLGAGARLHGHTHVGVYRALARAWEGRPSEHIHGAAAPTGGSPAARPRRVCARHAAARRHRARHHPRMSAAELRGRIAGLAGHTTRMIHHDKHTVVENTHACRCWLTK